jgi:Cu-Zn family superoxide dismutase
VFSRRTTLATATCAGLFALTACGQSEGQGEALATSVVEEGQNLTVTMIDADGSEVGFVEVAEHGEGSEVSIDAYNLEPGFHGFHVHTAGECETDSADPEDPATTGDFLSAGGHLAETGTEHGEHAGDLPPIRVGEDGRASMELHTDGFTVEDLRDEDGSAFMIHDRADNFANIPQRYALAGADEETRATGDAGDRVACGVVDPG